MKLATAFCDQAQARIRRNVDGIYSSNNGDKLVQDIAGELLRLHYLRTAFAVCTHSHHIAPHRTDRRGVYASRIPAAPPDRHLTQQADTLSHNKVLMSAEMSHFVS